MEVFVWCAQFPELSYSERLALMAQSASDWLQIFAWDASECGDKSFYLELVPMA